jgi:hypothetical protein
VQQEGYIRWPTNQDIPLILTLADASAQPLTGKVPQVSIRRFKETRGPLLDNYYWNATLQNFIAAPVWYNMTEVDSVGSPGLYAYTFAQTLVGVEHIYHVYYRHTATPVGFSFESHMITNEVYIPSSQPDPIVVGPTSVMGQLELVKGLLHHNAMLDKQTYTYGQLATARLRVFDTPAHVPTVEGGTETVGRIAEFSVESTYDTDGLNKKYVLKRVYP